MSRAGFMQQRLAALAGVGYADPAKALASGDRRVAYLIRAVLTGVLPDEPTVEDDAARALTDGPAVVRSMERAAARAPRWLRSLPVRIESGLLSDVTDTADSDFTTGIQRVARELLAALSDCERPLPVRMVRPGTFRTLTPAERSRAVGSAAEPAIVVPWEATFLLAEIATDRWRSSRIASIATYGAKRSVAVGYDCIPITTAETAPPGMPGAFSTHLAAIARFDAVVAISGAAASEFEGWASMLPAAGLTPPRIVEVPLPFAGLEAVPESEIAVRQDLGLGERAVVLVVGSHEPRKNHVTLLTAAELLWREGLDFTMVFAGGRSWDSAEFDALVARLLNDGRPVVRVTGADDERIAALYRMARLSLFVSINEGFGLPVAESLGVGTPVVTADFGSQREIAEGRGGVLVSPHDAGGIADAMRAVLLDDAVAAELAAGAGAVETGSWRRYAAHVMAAFRG